MDLSRPMKRVVGRQHLERVPAVLDLVPSVSVRAAGIPMRTRILKVPFELLGPRDGGQGRAPVLAQVAAGIDPFAIAQAGQLGDLGQDADASARETHQAIDLERLLFIASVVRSPIVATEEGLVVFAAAEAAQDVQIGEPAAEEVGHPVLAVDGAGTAAGEDHASRDVEVVLPRYRHFKCVGGDDLQGGKHDGGGQVGIGNLAGGVIEGTTEGRKNVLDPVSDSIGGFGMFQEACPMARGISEQEMEKILVSDGHCDWLAVSGFRQAVEPPTLRQNAFKRVLGAIVRHQNPCGMVEEMMEI